MENEEKEAMWERINTLEAENLEITRLIGNLYAFTSSILAGNLGASTGRRKNINAYLMPKYEEFISNLEDARNTKEVLKIISKFRGDFINFTEAMSE